MSVEGEGYPVEESVVEAFALFDGRSFFDHFSPSTLRRAEPDMPMRSPRARAMDAAEETMAGLDAAAEDAMGGIGDSAPLLSDTSLEDAAGEFLLRLQRQTGIPAAALLPLILSLSSIAVILLCQALFALLVRVAFGDARRGGAHSNGSVLLLGVCGAGKTALFQTLRSGSPYLTTVTSMEANDATILMEGKTRKSGVVAKKLRVVDLPGHPRLGGLLETHVRSARSAVFVIDAVDFASRRREIAERLFHALQTIAKAKGRAARTFPLIVACNKSEKITAHPIAFIKSRLEKEMDALLRTAGSLAETGSKGDDRKDAANRKQKQKHGNALRLSRRKRRRVLLRRLRRRERPGRAQESHGGAMMRVSWWVLFNTTSTKTKSRAWKASRLFLANTFFRWDSSRKE